MERNGVASLMLKRPNGVTKLNAQMITLSATILWHWIPSNLKGIEEMKYLIWVILLLVPVLLTAQEHEQDVDHCRRSAGVYKEDVNGVDVSLKESRHRSLIGREREWRTVWLAIGLLIPTRFMSTCTSSISIQRK